MMSRRLSESTDTVEYRISRVPVRKRLLRINKVFFFMQSILVRFSNSAFTKDGVFH